MAARRLRFPLRAGHVVSMLGDAADSVGRRVGRSRIGPELLAAWQRTRAAVSSKRE